MNFGSDPIMPRLIVSLEFDFSPCTSRPSPKAHSDQSSNPPAYSIPTLSQEPKHAVRIERRAWLQLTNEDNQIAVSKSAELVPPVQPRFDTGAVKYGSTALTGKFLSSGWQRHRRVHCRASTSETEGQTSFRCPFHPFSYSFTAARDDRSMLEEPPRLITRRTSRSLAGDLKNWKLNLSEIQP